MTLHESHDFRQIDPEDDPTEMCIRCLVCACCEPERAAAPCKGEPEWLDPMSVEW